jgi:hypothetical protein
VQHQAGVGALITGMREKGSIVSASQRVQLSMQWMIDAEMSVS